MKPLVIEVRNPTHKKRKRKSKIFPKIHNFNHRKVVVQSETKPRQQKAKPKNSPKRESKSIESNT